MKRARKQPCTFLPFCIAVLMPIMPPAVEGTVYMIVSCVCCPYSCYCCLLPCRYSVDIQLDKTLVNKDSLRDAKNRRKARLDIKKKFEER